MKIKLDENLGNSLARLFLAAGHEATTVREEGISGLSDRELINVCRSGRKVLVTLDNHFGNVVNYPPKNYSGIIVLRPSRDAKLSDVIEVAKTAIEGLKTRPIASKLWSIRVGRIREHREDLEEEGK